MTTKKLTQAQIKGLCAIADDQLTHGCVDYRHQPSDATKSALAARGLVEYVNQWCLTEAGWAAIAHMKSDLAVATAWLLRDRLPTPIRVCDLMIHDAKDAYSPVSFSAVGIYGTPIKSRGYASEGDAVTGARHHMQRSVANAKRNIEHSKNVLALEHESLASAEAALAAFDAKYPEHA